MGKKENYIRTLNQLQKEFPELIKKSKKKQSPFLIVDDRGNSGVFLHSEILEKLLTSYEEMQAMIQVLADIGRIINDPALTPDEINVRLKELAQELSLDFPEIDKDKEA